MLIKLFNTKALWIGEKCGVVVNGTPILIVHTEQGIMAYQDRCPHAGALLSEGFLKDDVITCARHGWQFSANTGEGINPCLISLKHYPIFIDEVNDIWIEME